MRPQYAEIFCKTHYSFLRGASSPGELIEQAAALGYPALGIADRGGVYGLPKAFLAAKSHPELKLISGADLLIDQEGQLAELALLAVDRAGYGLLCRLLSASHVDQPKGEGSLSWNTFLKMAASHPASRGLIAVPIAGALWPDERLGALHEIFKDQFYLPVSRFLDGEDPARISAALALQRKFGAKLVATNQVHTHVRERRRLQDVLTAIREGVTLKDAGFRLFQNAERHLKSPEEMVRLFEDLPHALQATLEITERCHFSLSELRYRYPSEWIPAAETAQSHLEKLVWQGARWRYSGEPPEEVKKQLQHELKLIQELQFADYFLTIWEIVKFAKEREILCQGRGSAANSAVCFCLGITAVDPVRMKLLFERFISAERGEPPDIDVDFEHERREEVIQHVYEKYGRERAAMVSAVITYRSRSAIREVSKVFGQEMSKREFETKLDEPSPSSEILLMAEIVEELKGFPRHLSIHSGGFTLSADPMIEIVPIEPARMEARTIVQWDKYDLDALGLLKVDLLALGMLSALKKTMKLAGNLELAKIPPEDPPTYEMIRKADTVGVFQIESRAQMSMLPRLLPRTFYDLVIEVALVRPGPIVGKMVHPYLKSRRGLESATLPDPRLEPILGRTLGVPLFQEQVMKMAIVLAGFTPGEADELRRAIGAWRSSGSIDKLGRKLMEGLLRQGIPRSFADMIFSQIQGFAEYGFPESHAASFALLVYASCYLKRHYPAEFTCALLNSQPMGFYSPHTLVDDAKRHGVKVLPLDLNVSEWDCTLENRALRIGWCYVSGISRDEAEQAIVERTKRPFSSLQDFLARTRLRSNILCRLAFGNAFSKFGFDQRGALWEILAQTVLCHEGSSPQLNLFAGMPTERSSPFSSLDEYGSINADYSVYGLSTRGHPMQALRAQIKRLPKTNAAMAKDLPAGRTTEVAGVCIVMQRPPTASGTVFATLEDETGFLDLMLLKDVYAKYCETLLDHCFLAIQGRIQRDGQSVNMRVQKVRPIFDSDPELHIEPRLFK